MQLLNFYWNWLFLGGLLSILTLETSNFTSMSVGDAEPNDIIWCGLIKITHATEKSDVAEPTASTIMACKMKLGLHPRSGDNQCVTRLFQDKKCRQKNPNIPKSATAKEHPLYPPTKGSEWEAKAGYKMPTFFCRTPPTLDR